MCVCDYPTLRSSDVIQFKIERKPQRSANLIEINAMVLRLWCLSFSSFFPPKKRCPCTRLCVSTIEARKGPLFLCVFCGGGRCDRDRSSVNDTDYCVDCSIDQSRVRCTVTRSTMETNNSLVTPCYCQCRLQTFQSSCDAHCRALSNCCAYKIHTKNRKENLQKKKTKLASCCRPK